MGLPALRSEARNLIDRNGKRWSIEDLPHDFADCPGGADHCNAWQHV